MNKKITSSVLAALLIAGSTSFTTFAAMKNGTVVIGAKAYDLIYANDPANASEIGNEVVAGGAVYVKDFNGDWFDNLSGLAASAGVIPAVVYKSATQTISFNAADTDTGGVVIIPDPVKDVTAPVLNAVSFTIGQTVSATKDANGDYKLSLVGLSDTAMFTAINLSASEKATIKIYFKGMSKTVTTDSSGQVTILVSDLLGALDPQKDGISVKSLKSVLTNGTGNLTATLTDLASNEKTVNITISAN